MRKSPYQLWVAHELIPFLQDVFRSRVRPDGIAGREWDNAWYRMVESATRHVRSAVSDFPISWRQQTRLTHTGE